MASLLNGTGDHAQQSFAGVPASARAARMFVADTLRRHGAGEAVIGDYQLVVGELAANAIEHGGGSALTVVIDAADRRWWQVEVVGGSALPSSEVLRPESWVIAAAGERSGRGLGIVRELMDDVVAQSVDGQVSIRCRLRRSGAS